MIKTRSKLKQKIDFGKKESINPEVVLLKNQLARVLADYDNLRKRTEEEKALWVKFSTQRVLTTLLSILDNFEFSQKHLNDPGLAIAIGEFKKLLGEEGLEEIVPKEGEDFDHNLHEAVESVEVKEPGKEGKVAELLLPGWKFKESEEILPVGRSVIRHAKVKVYNKS
jgi:molecular chaperone GrpE